MRWVRIDSKLSRGRSHHDLSPLSHPHFRNTYDCPGPPCSPLFNFCKTLLCSQGSTDWPVFFEHLGRVHSIHNKWELTFAVKTNFGHFEQKLLNISRRIDSFKLEEPTVEFVEDERKEEEEEEEESKEDRIFRLVNEHWDGLASLLRRRSNTLLHRLRDYRSGIFHECHNIAE